jgi:hypothetical protein
MRIGSTTVAAAALSLLALALGTARADDAPKGRVKITITKVRATVDPAAPAGAQPEVDPALSKLPIDKLKSYNFTKYALEQETERIVPWKSPVIVPLGDGGSYEVVAEPSSKTGHVVVSVTERAPSQDKPCLQIVGHEVPSGKVRLWFCDRADDHGTQLFFVTTEPVDD